MKHLHLIYLAVISVAIIGSSFYRKDDNSVFIKSSNEMTNVKIKITVNAQTFAATILDNDAAKAFKEMLPLTIKMIELNGNEKYGDLQKNLPINPSNPKTIKAGDLMLYGSNTLVLFYQTFSTSYSYTKLGEVDDASGLASALGPRDAIVTFELEKGL